jgi:hypothetical protein
MFNDNGDNTALLDAIIKSSVPTRWIDADTAFYRFNEITVTARFTRWNSPDDASVEILEWEDHS